MKRSKRRCAGPGLLALALAAGCAWSGPTFRSKSLAEGRAPGPTLVLQPWYCGGEPYTGNSNQIIVETATAEYAYADLSAYASALEPRGPADVRPPAGACGDIRPQRIREGDRMVPAAWARSVASSAGASSLLLMTVDTTWKCTNEGETIGGTFIAFGISRCYEHRTTLGAALVDTEGRVLWSAFRSASMGHPDQAPPQPRNGVAALVEELPIASTVGG